MKATSRLTAPLKRRGQDLIARVQRLTARRVLEWLAATLLRILRLSREQIRGGRPIVKRDGVWYVPLWLPIAIAIAVASTAFWGDAARSVARLSSAAVRLASGEREANLAPFFAPAVRHWSAQINRWSAQYDVDPQLMATVMQIESCGHPKAVSNAGAQGLFQVMPFHFEAGEDMLNPATNAKRGLSFLKYCESAADGVVGLTLACYNGGPSVINRGRDRWSRETQTYYRWGVGIYSDALASAPRSETFDQWLAAGGDRLCASALKELEN